MKTLVFIFINLFIFCLGSYCYGQKEFDSKQLTNAKLFLSDLVGENYNNCWKLYDKKTNSTINKNDFLKKINEIKHTLPRSTDNFVFYMYGFMMQSGDTLPYYSFKYEDDISKPVPSYVIDIFFCNNKSLLIAGILPKKLVSESDQVSTTSGNETTLESSMIWDIDGKIYYIRGINIVHFENNQAIIAVQIEYEFQLEQENKEWAYKEGIKFANYLNNNGYYLKGIEKAKEINRTLLDDIGISFINPKSGEGYNIMIKKEDYK